jgi:hypothetical protein
MSTCNDRFNITRGYDNTFVFTIKANGSTLPMEIAVGDTFTASLVRLCEQEGVSTCPNPRPIVDKALNVVDALSGKVELVLSAAETSSLVSEKGDKVDRYYAKPAYKLVIECSTQNNGDFLAKVDEVYVD